MTIVNVRGTHGAGKTTIVRTIMERYRSITPLMIDRRKRPIGHICKGNGKRLFVPGAYDDSSTTGGCDTIQTVDVMYGLIRKYAKKGYDVLFEGIVAQHSTPNIARLKRMGYDVSIVVIDIAVEDSIKGVEKRRKKKGDTRPLVTTNLLKEARDLVNTAERLRADGVYVVYPKTRRAATDRTLKLLGLS